MSLSTRGVAAAVRARAATNRAVHAERGVRLPAPDGALLLTDLYLAEPVRPRPVILVRTPYGREGVTGIFVHLARLFAERGYHAVVQSTRGTFGSGGVLGLHQEPGDGRATADWIIRQPWSNGEIGTYGPSYLSFTQWALASTRPPQLKAMAIQIMAADRHRVHYPGGAFALDTALTWSYSMAHQELGGTAGLRAALGRRLALDRASGHLPLIAADLVATGREVPFYREWLRHEQGSDPYWEQLELSRTIPGLGVPVSMVAGWYDYYLPSQLSDYAALRRAGAEVRLRVGGWRHGSVDGLAHGFREALAWFDRHLLHIDTGPTPRVSVEVMGGGGWQDLEEWPPPAAEQRWLLQPGGVLARRPAPDSEPDRYRYDPADPTPQVGGSSLSRNSGRRDNSRLESRADVLTYTSPPLTEDLEVIGQVVADLHVESSREHTDFFARLCDVDPRGRSWNVSDGLLRLGPGDDRHIRIELWPTAHCFRPGHRVRLQVSSGAHPRYARNLGGGEPQATGTAMRRSEQAVHHDPRRPSALVLPVPG